MAVITLDIGRLLADEGLCPPDVVDAQLALVQNGVVTLTYTTAGDATVTYYAEIDHLERLARVLTKVVEHYRKDGTS